MPSLISWALEWSFSLGASTNITFRMSIIITDPVLPPVHVIGNASHDLLQVYAYSNVHPVSTFNSVSISISCSHHSHGWSQDHLQSCVFGFRQINHSLDIIAAIVQQVVIVRVVLKVLLAYTYLVSHSIAFQLEMSLHYTYSLC
jgi:hypothetical protein